MNQRTLILVALVAAAAGGSYLWSNPPQALKGAKQSVQAWTSSSASSSSSVTEGSSGVIAPLDVSTAESRSGNAGNARFRRITDVPLEGMPIYKLEDVLRMDISMGWVYSRWARKSTALPDLDLFGIRVPLMTGTKIEDLAGSLTYYFNRAGQVQRISFHGRTGDTRKLVTLVVSKYGFRMQPAEVAGEQLYQVKWNGRAISELRIRTAPVLWATTPHASFQVDLQLERPGSGRYLDSTRQAAKQAATADVTR
jgi:hypothetical protein